MGICLFLNGAHRFFRLLISGRVLFVFDFAVWEIFDQKYTKLEIQPVFSEEKKHPQPPWGFCKFWYTAEVQQPVSPWKDTESQ